MADHGADPRLDRLERLEPRGKHLARRADDRGRIRVDRRDIGLERRVVVGRDPFGHGRDRLRIAVDRPFRGLTRVGIAQVVADDGPEDGAVVRGVEQPHERGGVGDLGVIDGEPGEHDAQFVAVEVERGPGLPPQVRLGLGQPGPVVGRQVVRGARVVREAEDEVVRGPDVPFDGRPARAVEVPDARARGAVRPSGRGGWRVGLPSCGGRLLTCVRCMSNIGMTAVSRPGSGGRRPGPAPKAVRSSPSIISGVPRRPEPDTPGVPACRPTSRPSRSATTASRTACASSSPRTTSPRSSRSTSGTTSGRSTSRQDERASPTSSST